MGPMIEHIALNDGLIAERRDDAPAGCTYSMSSPIPPPDASPCCAYTSRTRKRPTPKSTSPPPGEASTHAPPTVRSTKPLAHPFADP